jgi:CBS domain-containing protein
MEVELLEIQDFIRQYPPFDELPEEAFQEVAKSVEISYSRADTNIIAFKDDIHELYMIRSGVVEIYRRNGQLHNRLDQGELFGQMGLLTNSKVLFPAKSIKDTLLYCIPDTVFYSLCERFEYFADFVEAEDSARLKHAVNNKNAGGNDLTTSKVKTLLTREPLILPLTTSIREVAKTMADEYQSAALINDPESEIETNGFVGLITEHDLCSKVVAQGICIDTPVSEVMTTELISLDRNAYISEAMLIMLRYNVHHLPILKNKRPIGLMPIS